MSERDVTDAPSAPVVSAPILAGHALPEGRDREAVLTRLMTDHGEAVYALCVRILRDRTLAEDVLQQTFIEAHRDLDRFQGRSSVRTWLLGIASHRCQDAIKSLRRRQRRFETDDSAMATAADPTADPVSPIERARIQRALEDCLSELSSETRSAVLLRFQSGMSYEHMAEVVGDKADTVRARVCRALPLLRRCLEGKGWDGD